MFFYRSGPGDWHMLYWLMMVASIIGAIAWFWQYDQLNSQTPPDPAASEAMIFGCAFIGLAVILTIVRKIFVRVFS